MLASIAERALGSTMNPRVWHHLGLRKCPVMLCRSSLCCLLKRSNALCSGVSARLRLACTCRAYMITALQGPHNVVVRSV